ncbi:hypothetical protein ABPG77_001798 [Micractinium sp. CCAP 211/92]
MGRLVYVLQAAPQHHFPRHPECPERVFAIQAALQRVGIAADGADGQVTRLEALPAELPPGLLEAVHTHEHVAALRETSARVQRPTAVRDPEDPDGPTFATPSSFGDAMTAACAAVALVDVIASATTLDSAGHSGSSGGRGEAGPEHQGEQQQQQGAGQPPGAALSPPVGFSLCRPPGHHATPGDQMGFCLLNNAALAARHAQRAHGLRKVLILDWDVHHGNGTQDIFYRDPSVLFVDLHQAGVWPGSGGEEEAGEGAGAGATLNVPLPWHSGHSAVQRVFQGVVAPAARRFSPDLIIVSAGYDAHWRDPLEHLQFQSATYHWLAGAVQDLAGELCSGRLLFVLEGGYDQAALGESVAETVLALLGRPSVHPLLEPKQLPHPEPAAEVGALVARLRQRLGL